MGTARPMRNLMTTSATSHPASFMADRLFVADRVITMDPALGTARAVLVKQGRIVAVGDVETLRDAAEGVPVTDYGDATIVPGLVDGHCHFEMATTVEVGWVQVHTPPYASLAEIAETIAREAKARPSDQWLLCRSSFSMHEKVEEQRLFSREELDEVCSDRPVAVFASLHVCSLNTAAMRALGLWEPTAVHPEHGLVHRDAAGTPTGVVTEAFLLIPTEMGQEEFTRAVVDKARHRWNALGTTSVHTMPESLDQAEWEIALHRDRALSLRQRHYFISPALGDIERVAEIREIYPTDDDMIAFGGVKLFVNGCAHDGLGRSLDDPKFTQEELDETVLTAHRRGLQVWMHSLNAKGIVTAARAIVGAVREVPGPHRHRIEHGGDYIDVADLDEVKASGALLVTTPQFMYSTAADLDPNHAPWRSILDAGVGLVGGTDSTGTVRDSVSVLRNVDVAVNRRGPGGVAVGPDQAVSRQEALAMFTTWASFGSFEEGRKGRLAPGLFADLTVLDSNPLDPAVGDIASVSVRATVLGGEVVFDAST